MKELCSVGRRIISEFVAMERGQKRQRQGPGPSVNNIGGSEPADPL